MDLSEYDLLIYQHYVWPNHRHSLHGITTPFFSFCFTYLFSITFLYFFIISFIFPYLSFSMSIFIQSHVNSNINVSTTGIRGTKLSSPLFYFLSTYLFSIKCLYFFIISTLFPYFNFLMSILMQLYVFTETYMCRPQTLVARIYPPPFLAFCLHIKISLFLYYFISFSLFQLVRVLIYAILC